MEEVTSSITIIIPSRRIGSIRLGESTVLLSISVRDLQGNISKISYIDNRSGGTADFSYRPNEESIIYFVDSEYLRVLDYEQEVVLMWCDVTNGLRDVTTTLDGKHVLAYRTPYPNSEIFVFETEGFYTYSGFQPMHATQQALSTW